MKKKAILTICITTYNRSGITTQLISKLPYKRQVEYIVIDDGSDKVAFNQLKRFINQSHYPVQLLRKKNGGKLAAIRHVLPHAKGHFFMDLDSDDGFTEENLLNILTVLEEIQNKNELNLNIIGTVGLCTDVNNKIIGDKFLDSSRITNYLKMRLDDQIKGDKEEIILTEVLKALTIPTFKNENRIPTTVQWYSLGAKKCLFVNKVYSKKNIHEVERISDNILSKIIKNKNGTRLHFKTIMQQKANYANNYYFLKAIIQYIRFSCHGAYPFIEREIWKKHTFLLILLFPLGFLGYSWDHLRLFKMKIL